MSQEKIEELDTKAYLEPRLSEIEVRFEWIDKKRNKENNNENERNTTIQIGL